MLFFGKEDPKPAISLLDIFLDSIREKYTVETYYPTPESLVISVILEDGRDPLVLNINNVEQFKRALFFYISSLNSYYLKNSRKKLDKTIGELCRNLLVGTGKLEGLDFTNYLNDITTKINSLSEIVQENNKQL